MPTSASPAASPPPPAVPDDGAELVASLRADLAMFTVAAVDDVLGPMASAALHREQAIPAQRATAASSDPLATLIRLFTLGDAVDPAELAQALPTLGAAGAQSLGLIRPEGAGYVATCDLRPYADEDHDWWVASDLSELATASPLAPDHVLGIGGASITLASWTPRRVVTRGLDVGTGSGVQALHLSGHCEFVTVTDMSQRALAFATFNAAVNDCHWRTESGSLLEPVRGEQFDLVVSNPPFVITPRAAAMPHYEYRDAGRAGDDVVAELIHTVGSVLAPGGVAQFLGNWEIGAGADWRDRVRSWLDGAGVDAWVIQREVQDPAQYAETWSRDGGHLPNTPQYNAMYAAWLDDFAAREVAGIGFGIVTLHKPRATRAVFIDLQEHYGPVAPAMGPTIDAGLAAREWLAEHSDEEVSAQQWVLADDVTQERHYQIGDNDPTLIQLRQGGGLRSTLPLSSVGAAFASVADGDITAQQAVVAIASLMDLDEDQVRDDVLATIRAGYGAGMFLR